MFFRTIYDLWYFDAAARRRYQIRTIVVAFLYGVFNSLALGRPEARVTWETLSLIGVLTVAFTVFYCLRKQASTKYKALRANFREFLQERGLLELGLVSAIILVCVSLVKYLPSNKVEAFSLNSQLRAIASPGRLSSLDARSLGAVFQKATERGLRLNPQLVTTANDRLLNESRSNPDAWSAALDALSYRSGLNIEASTSFPQKEGCFVRPPADGITVTIERLTIVGCDGQALDGLQLKDMRFKDSTIVYHGGPAVLQNVEFENCRFILDYSPGARKLARALTESQNVTITLPGR